MNQERILHSSRYRSKNRAEKVFGEKPDESIAPISPDTISRLLDIINFDDEAPQDYDGTDTLSGNLFNYATVEPNYRQLADSVFTQELRDYYSGICYEVNIEGFNDEFGVEKN
jgi:hypothetical protein